MATTKCGFDDKDEVLGRDSLITFGPTLFVNIGFDPAYNPAAKPTAPPNAQLLKQPALVDSGATQSCIDGGIAQRLGLPVVDKQRVSGIGGICEVNMYLAQIYVPSLNYTIYGSFAGVDLVAGGQVHLALIGRTFLQDFTMVYEGKTGNVSLTS